MKRNQSSRKGTTVYDELIDLLTVAKMPLNTKEIAELLDRKPATIATAVWNGIKWGEVLQRDGHPYMYSLSKRALPKRSNTPKKKKAKLPSNVVRFKAA